MYAILIVKRKLRHYFESHPMTVVTSFPLGEVVQNQDAMGRIIKWALELMGQGISYASRMAIKSQVLADFRCRVDRDPNAISNHRPRVLDDVLLWIADEERRRHGAGLCFAPRGTHEVHGSHPFPLLQ